MASLKLPVKIDLNFIDLYYTLPPRPPVVFFFQLSASAPAKVSAFCNFGGVSTGSWRE
jgi:hypothetical protein